MDIIARYDHHYDAIQKSSRNDHVPFFDGPRFLESLGSGPIISAYWAACCSGFFANTEVVGKTIEIVDLPIENGGSFHSYGYLLARS